MSAIGYIHKIQDLQDPTSAFLVSKLVAGAYRLKPVFDVGLPITISILNRLVASLPYITSSPFEKTLYQAMFLLAFNSFARIGAITSNNSTSHSRALQYSDVNIHSLRGEPNKVSVTFRFYKHNLTASPYTISFAHGPTDFSAVSSLVEYFKIRGNYAGPLFCHADQASVTRVTFDRCLHRALSFCKSDGSRFKGLSFRIGAATYATQNNMSDSQIRALGRWSSNAFRKYIRLSG